MKCLRNLTKFLREYCENCTIAGLCFIADRRLHLIERICWLLCIALSSIGAYSLINRYRMDFQRKAVSIVYESMPRVAKYQFPTVSVCNFFKSTVSDRIEKHVRSNCQKNCENDYDYEMENQLLMFVYPHNYHHGSIRTKCEKLERCVTCNKCFQREERIFLEEFPFNCSELFVECSSNGEIFDCCQYFRPLVTPFGLCFLLNSEQNNDKNTKNWFKKSFISEVDSMDMTITSSVPMHITVLNREDVPNLLLPGASVTAIRNGKRKDFQIYFEKMINDNDVFDISPEYRKCRFSYEPLPTSVYKVHSFNACLNDCIRMHQKRLCNCSMQSLLPKPDPAYPPCDLHGLYCLENHSLIRPDAKRLLPWSKSGNTCQCQPSCTEYAIEAVYESRPIDIKNKDNYEVKINIPKQSYLSFRRQAIRTHLDVIVTAGGILGLFLGASILSGVEILHYIMLWILSTMKP